MIKIIKELYSKEVKIVLKNNNKLFGILESYDKELYLNVKGNIMGIDITKIKSVEENIWWQVFVPLFSL